MAAFIKYLAWIGIFFFRGVFNTLPNISYYHYVKSVRIRSFSGPHFPTFGLNMLRLSVSLSIQSKWRKILTRKESVLGVFLVRIFVFSLDAEKNSEYGQFLRSVFLQKSSTSIFDRILNLPLFLNNDFWHENNFLLKSCIYLAVFLENINATSNRSCWEKWVLVKYFWKF